MRIHGKDHWYANFGYYSADMPIPRQKYIKEEDGLLWAYGDGGAIVTNDAGLKIELTLIEQLTLVHGRPNDNRLHHPFVRRRLANQV